MRRRAFVAGLAAAPIIAAARAQQPAPSPVVGFLSFGEPELNAELVAAFGAGLRETGYVDGRNVAIEYRWTRYDNDRLPALAADLVGRQVAAIAAIGMAAARVVKGATATIPVVCTAAADPVEAGLVTSLNQPGGNVTGVTTMNIDMAPKWVELMHELLPAATRLGVLANLANARGAETMVAQAQAAAASFGLQTESLSASTERDIDAVFEGLREPPVQALLVQADQLFLEHRARVAALAVQHRLPAIYATREFPLAGGLMSYGSSFADAHRLVGVYVGRILKGEKPGDLPVIRPTSFDFVINLKTARALGLDIPPTFLLRATEVIE